MKWLLMASLWTGFAFAQTSTQVIHLKYVVPYSGSAKIKAVSETGIQPVVFLFEGSDGLANHLIKTFRRYQTIRCDVEASNPGGSFSGQTLVVTQINSCIDEDGFLVAFGVPNQISDEALRESQNKAASQKPESLPVYQGERRVTKETLTPGSIPGLAPDAVLK